MLIYHLLCFYIYYQKFDWSIILFDIHYFFLTIFLYVYFYLFISLFIFAQMPSMDTELADLTKYFGKATKFIFDALELG